MVLPSHWGRFALVSGCWLLVVGWLQGDWKKKPSAFSLQRSDLVSYSEALLSSYLLRFLPSYFPAFGLL